MRLASVQRPSNAVATGERAGRRLSDPEDGVRSGRQPGSGTDRAGPGDLWANSLYRNEGTTNHWLAVELTGGPGNHSAIGARVEVHAGSRRLVEVGSGGGFGSTNSLAVEFGLGPGGGPVDELVVRWPGGGVDHYRALPADRFLPITQK